MGAAAFGGGKPMVTSSSSACSTSVCPSGFIPMISYAERSAAASASCGSRPSSSLILPTISVSASVAASRCACCRSVKPIICGVVGGGGRGAPSAGLSWGHAWGSGRAHLLRVLGDR